MRRPCSNCCKVAKEEASLAARLPSLIPATTCAASALPETGGDAPAAESAASGPKTGQADGEDCPYHSVIGREAPAVAGGPPVPALRLPASLRARCGA
jgi:hypothetical protein